MSRSSAQHAVAATAATFLLGACQPTLLSPPAGAPLLESSEPVGRGQVGAGALVGSHAGLFGPQVLSAQFRARYGVRHDLETSGSMSMLHVETSGLVDPPHPNAYSARLSLKWAPYVHSALVGGLGGGGSAAGGFVAPDLGVLLAYENDWVVPVFSTQTGVSIPIVPRTVDLSSDDVRITDRAELTMSLAFGLGAVIVASRPPTAQEPDRVGIEIPLGLHWVRLADDDRAVGLGGVAVGAQATWGAR